MSERLPKLNIDTVIACEGVGQLWLLRSSRAMPSVTPYDPDDDWPQHVYRPMAIENEALRDRTWELFYVIYPRLPASAAFVLSQNPPVPQP
jgi:hypothetical protein